MLLPPAAAWSASSGVLSRRVAAALALAGALACVFFVLNQCWGPHSIILISATALCSAGAAVGSTKAATGQLRWDGERWHWSGVQDLAVVRLQCAIDWQRLLLLRIECETGPGVWLWLASPAMDARWRALRRAVVAAGQAEQRTAPDSLPE